MSGTPNPVPQNLPKPSSPKTDSALQTAWEHLLEYDHQSTQQKGTYTWLRLAVISLIFIVNCLAVLQGLLQAIWDENAAAWQGDAKEVIRLLLIFLPVLGVTLVNYSAQFASSTTWITYRVIAERIRSHIYQYRINRAYQAELDEVEQGKKLVDAVYKTTAEALTVLPIQEKKDKNLFQKRLDRTTSKGDNGFSPMTIEHYLEWRLDPQIDWYVDRIERDYRALRRFRRVALGVSAAGAVFAGINANWSTLVAITTTLGVALNLWADVRMFGRTYQLYQLTEHELRRERSLWLVRSPEERNDSTLALGLVSKVEDILAGEREKWCEQAKTVQQASEEVLSRLVQSPSQPLDDDEDDSAGGGNS